jgi:hypothetical protein
MGMVAKIAKIAGIHPNKPKPGLQKTRKIGVGLSQFSRLFVDQLHRLFFRADLSV